MKYIGTKTIEAQPMMKKEAEKVLGRTISTSNFNQDADEEGYLVTHEDGYKSWSPKIVFEKAYKKADTYLDRIEIEYQELRDKYLKAEAFLLSDKGRSMPDNDRTCLKKQTNIMDQYLQILDIRIYNAKEDIRVAAERKRKAEEARKAAGVGK